jgi:hypothetical protein
MPALTAAEVAELEALLAADDRGTRGQVGTNPCERIFLCDNRRARGVVRRPGTA